MSKTEVIFKVDSDGVIWRRVEAWEVSEYAKGLKPSEATEPEPKPVRKAVTGHTYSPPPAKPARKPMSEAAKKRLSKMMKERWAKGGKKAFNKK